MTIITDRLAQLDTITLDHGSHDNFDEGHCAMEVVAYLAGEGHTDAPDCASPVLRSFTIELNDQWDTERRQKLKPFLPRMVGTSGDGLDEARSYLALDWLVRTYTPAWLDLAGLTAEAQSLRDLRRIADHVAADSAGPVVSAARDAAQDAARDAAWDAAWASARAAARVAAGVAAGDAAGDAAWDAAQAAAWDAAQAAARVAAGDAAWDAAWVAAQAALRPTVETLQASALDLLDRMISPDKVAQS